MAAQTPQAEWISMSELCRQLQVSQSAVRRRADRYIASEGWKAYYREAERTHLQSRIFPPNQEAILRQVINEDKNNRSGPWKHPASKPQDMTAAAKIGVADGETSIAELHAKVDRVLAILTRLM